MMIKMREINNCHCVDVYVYDTSYIQDDHDYYSVFCSLTLKWQHNHFPELFRINSI